MADNDGKLVYGREGTLLFGSADTLLYYHDETITFDALCTISWSAAGKDLDICAFFSHDPSQKIGWSYVSDIETGGVVRKDGSKTEEIGDGKFTATWGGDNTDGGPETISIHYHGTKGYLVGKRFEVRCNWYNRGEGYSSGNYAYVNLVPQGATGLVNWTTGNQPCSPAQRNHEAATQSDPGVAYTFGPYGSGASPSIMA